MQIFYHRLIQRDLREAIDYHDERGGSDLGNRFFAATENATVRAIGSPQRFHHVTPSLRRIQLEGFRYHFLFAENRLRIKFVVLRHDNRHPGFGLGRKV